MESIHEATNAASEQIQESVDEPDSEFIISKNFKVKVLRNQTNVRIDVVVSSQESGDNRLMYRQLGERPGNYTLESSGR